MLHPHCVLAQNSKALLFFKIGVNEKHLDKKIDYFQKAITADSTFVEVYYNLGVAYKQNRDYQKAEKFLQKASRLSGMNDEPQTKTQIVYELGIVYKLLGKLDDYVKALYCKESRIASNTFHRYQKFIWLWDDGIGRRCMRTMLWLHSTSKQNILAK